MIEYAFIVLGLGSLLLIPMMISIGKSGKGPRR